MKTFIALSAMLAAFALHTAVHAEEPAEKPVLCPQISRGESYLIHAVPVFQAAPTTPTLSPSMRLQASDYTVVHTDRATGSMQTLFAPQKKKWDFIGGINRHHQSSTHLAGMVADNERLYLLAREDTHTEILTPQVINREYANFVLQVFWLRDGSKIYSHPVKAVSRAEIPQEWETTTLKHGPLNRLPNGVSCFGQTFQFTGREFKQAAPVPKADNENESAVIAN